MIIGSWKCVKSGEFCPPHFQLIKVLLPTPIMEIISQEVCILAYELLPVFFSLQTVQISVGQHAFVLQDATQLVGDNVWVDDEHNGVFLCFLLIIIGVVRRFSGAVSYSSASSPYISCAVCSIPGFSGLMALIPRHRYCIWCQSRKRMSSRLISSGK